MPLLPKLNEINSLYFLPVFSIYIYRPSFMIPHRQFSLFCKMQDTRLMKFKLYVEKL